MIEIYSPFSAVALREELFVSLTNGFAHRISWTGNVDAEFSIRLSSIPFAPDQLQSKRGFQIIESSDSDSAKVTTEIS